ncbi:MAG TPA: hypothetical protein DEA90_16260 [Opitutae bacterium]|nr:hypothetical protein [Opitutae bacterium]
MILTAARPFQEALESRQAKSILPTTLRTRDLSRLSPAVRERAMFSAAVTDVRFLDDAHGLVDDLLKGDTDLATARLNLDTYLKGVGYQGDTFSGDLTDLRSLARKNVLLETNLGLSLGYGQWKQGQNPVTLNMWPAQELIRVENRREPRTDWEERFLAAGGTKWNGRLIALINSPVWSTLSRFGYPYPPFDFNSGKGVRAVSRADAVSAGLIQDDEDLIPETRGLDEEARIPLTLRSAKLRQAISEQLAGIAEFQGDDLVKLAPNFSQTAESLGLPKIAAVRAAKPEQRTREQAANAIERLQAGIDITDATGTPVRLDSETMSHWKMKPDELARVGHLDRAIDTLQDPIEVWDQGTQRVFVNLYDTPKGTRAFMLFVRPSGQVDNYFTSKIKQVERNRRGRARIYAAGGSE